MVYCEKTIEKNFFPTIVQSSVYSNVEDLNRRLLHFVKDLIQTEIDDGEKNYITTENGAKQPRKNIILDYYGIEDCITEFVDTIVTPAQEKWVEHHFLELTGKPKPKNTRFNVWSWATLYPPGSYQTPHMHRDKMFTGIYYIKMNETKDQQPDINNPELNCEGSLVIQNPHPQSSQPIFGGWQTHREILPQEGECIIMPSWLSHFVKPFNSGERCVIVFDGQLAI